MTEKTVSVAVTAGILDIIDKLREKCRIVSCIIDGDNLLITLKVSDEHIAEIMALTEA